MLVLETFQGTNGLYHPHCCQKTIKKENKVKVLDENPLNSMSAKAQKSKTAIDHLLKQTVCVFFFTTCIFYSLFPAAIFLVLISCDPPMMEIM
jgi:hypothetical protein